jgi:hypothetical protein
MGVIALRQAPQMPRREIQPVIHPFLLFLLTVSVLSVAVTLYLARQELETDVYTMQEVVWEKTLSAAKNQSYSMVVEESGPGYNLRFSGQVENGLIYGTMDAYDLEIFTDQTIYYVRDSDVFKEWEELHNADLDGLTAIVRDPLELLQTLLSSQEVLVEEGPQRLVEDITCQTYFLEIPPPDIGMFTKFDQDATLDKLQLYLWFEKNELFLHRIAILLNITVKGEAIQINRIYNLNPKTKQLPDDLPQLSTGLIAI